MPLQLAPMTNYNRQPGNYVHGIGGSDHPDNLTVTNCEIAWIGGGIQYYNDDGNVVRFGGEIKSQSNTIYSIKLKTSVYKYTKHQQMAVYLNFLITAIIKNITAIWVMRVPHQRQI